MKNVAMLLAVVGVVGLLAGVALSADNNTISGTVSKVDGKVLKLKDTVKDKEVVYTVNTDDKTTVTLDGKDAKLADLKEGMTAVVTWAEGSIKVGASPVAGKIEAKSAAK